MDVEQKLSFIASYPRAALKRLRPEEEERAALWDADTWAKHLVVNERAEAMEKKVRLLLSSVAHQIDDGDEIWDIEEAKPTSEDRLRYCMQILGRLQQLHDASSKKAGEKSPNKEAKKQ